MSTGYETNLVIQNTTTNYSLSTAMPSLPSDAMAVDYEYVNMYFCHVPFNFIILVTLVSMEELQ